MEGLKNLLLKEQFRLEQMLQRTKGQLSDAPEGKLRISKSQNCIQYYYCTDERKTGTYITKGNEEFVKKLAQKSYDEKVLRLAEKRISQIKKLTKDYEEDKIEKIYSKEHIERQKLIRTVEPTWEQRINEWRAIEYKGIPGRFSRYTDRKGGESSFKI